QKSKKTLTAKSAKKAQSTQRNNENYFSVSSVVNFLISTIARTRVLRYIFSQNLRGNIYVLA
ncbi:MAG: hypothetical protein QME64_08265, partial [bacterium]|nr:hypothetical protein [bacterium]